MKKLDQATVEERISKFGYKLLGSYINSTTPLFLECPVGHTYNVVLSNFYSRNARCPECDKLKISQRCKTPWMEIQRIASDNGLTLLTTETEYGENGQKKTRIKVLCSCGRSRNLSWTCLRKHPKCIKCNKGGEKNKYTLEEAAELCASMGYTFIDKNYGGNKHKILILCKKHGEFRATLNGIQQGHGCRECGLDVTRLRSIRSRVPIERVRALIESRGGKMVSETYTCSNDKLEIECGNRHSFKMNWGHLSNGHWCSQCVNPISAQELEILGYIKSKFYGEVINNDRKILKGMELDLWIPSLNLGIEFDGLYWHCERNNPKAKEKSKKKASRIKDAGIKILMFFEDEWKDPIKRGIIKSMIDSRLGITETRMYARETNLEAVSRDEAIDFMNKNHLEGHAQFKNAIGLRDKSGSLVMCATFRSSKGKVLELARMATKINLAVVGGASKMISSVKEPLMSYSDNRLSLGGVYELLGFKEITETLEPSYWYTDFKKRVFRTKCMRKRDMEGTEREQAVAGAFGDNFGHKKPVYRIYGYGHRKWLKS